jgi:hypothetical protein
VDRAKGEVVFDVQVVAQNVLDAPTLLIYPDGHKRLTLGTKPTHIHLGEGFQVAVQKAKWYRADGKEIGAEAAVRHLKHGVLVLLSADGAEVDKAYLHMFKGNTLVLVVPADELPVPYNPHSGGFIAVKKIDRH